MSVAFEWSVGEFDDLAASCIHDEVLPAIMKVAEGGGRILESGCGAGRWVRYLADRECDVIGLEISATALVNVSRRWSDLKLVCGDSAQAPFGKGAFDAVISLGVVEHWQDGPSKPLREIFRLLRPGGVAVITVPCLNQVRVLKRVIWWNEVRGALRFLLMRIRRQGRNKLQINRRNPEFRYAVEPAVGPFFEYRFTPSDITNEVRLAGFDIVRHLPLGLMDGVYHDLNFLNGMVSFENWRFHPSSMGIWLNRWLAAKPFVHCHMQVIVAHKPEP